MTSRLCFSTIPVLSLSFAVFHATVRADCCSGRSGAAVSSSSSNGHGSIQEVFGGSAAPHRVTLNNSGSQPVTYSRAGRNIDVPAGGTVKRDLNTVNPGAGSIPAVPGEMVTPTVTNGSAGAAHGRVVGGRAPRGAARVARRRAPPAYE